MSVIFAISLSTMVLLSGADALVATEVIRAGTSLSAANTQAEDGTLSDEERGLLGREVRRTVYKGATINAANTRAPTLVSRNQTVTVKYQVRGLEITLNGRSMGAGAAGDYISVMNQETRKLVSGEIMPGGWVLAK